MNLFNELQRMPPFSLYAWMVKLVNTKDLKSFGRKTLRVQVSLRVQTLNKMWIITVIEVTKKGKILPVKVFNDWLKCGKWCDEFIKRDKGYDPTLYEVNEVKGFKKYLYFLFFVKIKKDHKRLS